MSIRCRLFLAVILLAACCAEVAAADVGPLLETLRAVGPEGAGNRQAAAAWEQLARADAAELPAILAGLDGANPLAANWIRTAADAIAQRQLLAGVKLPAGDLERFVLDRRHDPRARRLAYERLVRVDPAAPDRLLDGMLDDPSLEIRRDAVARQIEQAAAFEQAGNGAGAVAAYQAALTAARDRDQIQFLAERLRAMGQEVDLPRHFGFLVRWKVIGPLDNTDGRGFDAVYPPEQKIQLDSPCQGKHGPVRWIDYLTRDDYGWVDLNQALAEEKSVVGYATADYIAAARQEVELRAASYTAMKIWLNGRLVHQREVYHTGSQMDQFVIPVVLNPGRNTILVKVCQNERTEDWARYWGFQLRVCDHNAAALLSADRE